MTKNCMMLLMFVASAVGSGQSARAQDDTTSDPVDRDFACVQGTIDLMLSWTDGGRDFELHLIRPGGRINDDATDCTWTSCINGSPDWGAPGESRDDPVKDIDDTDELGPERICLAGPEKGTYTVLVEHWNSTGSPSADGEVVAEVAGVTTISQVSDLPPHSVWTAMTIDWPSGEVTPGTETIDCSASWSSGCTLDIP